MKNIGFANVDFTNGFLFDKYNLNKNVTIDAVYDRFYETGRIEAFKFNWKPSDGDAKKPNIFWDSDVAKWMEGAAYILRKFPNAKLEAKVDELVEDIKAHQCDDGYFNIAFTVAEPEKRWTNRDWHELYCAGHLFEAAVALADIGKNDLIVCMEKYADYIHKVFVEEKSAKFATPGHEEIELALMRMYNKTGKKKFLDLAAYFINTRGTEDDVEKSDYNQSHLPVRRQRSAVGHAVRAVYLYTGMAKLAKETGDSELLCACNELWRDITERKMYVTGGIGSIAFGEAFTIPYDLSNDGAYTETCAGIGLMYFAKEMSEIYNDAKYADVIERLIYNGMISGLSLSGDAFFYENPLEINLSEHFGTRYGERRFPITQRPKIFGCSCCPPNINRILASLGDYIFAKDGNTLFINQYTGATLSDNNMNCSIITDYPQNGKIIIKSEGAEKLAFRIPSWCDSFTVSKEYTLNKGYAYVNVAKEGDEIALNFEMPAVTVFSDSRVIRDVNKACVMRGPVVYCAESVDNSENLHSFSISETLQNVTEEVCEKCGLIKLETDAYVTVSEEGKLYSRQKPKRAETRLKLIPYCNFANRGKTNMLVWFDVK